MSTYREVNACLAVLNVKAQEGTSVWAFCVIVKTDCETDGSSAALSTLEPNIDRSGGF